MKRNIVNKTLLLNELNASDKDIEGIIIELPASVDNEDYIRYENHVSLTTEFFQTDEEQMSDELFRDELILKKKQKVNYI